MDTCAPTRRKGPGNDVFLHRNSYRCSPLWMVGSLSFFYFAITCGAMLLRSRTPTEGTIKPNSPLKAAWKEVTSRSGEWGHGHQHEHRGQICDPWRQKGANTIEPDHEPGCTVLFIADPDDYYNVGTVAEGEQNNFQNTQHYRSSWTLHGKGFLGDSLPRAPKDLRPVCYLANITLDGKETLVLGYEEGNGDGLMPCPGGDGSPPFTHEQLTDPDADWEDMCSQCYTAVCTAEGSVFPRHCGDSGNGEVELEDDASFAGQVTPAYHCHMTMADKGACDYVQFDQHEDSRTYYMDYSVTCGWQNIQYLNITYCDCTREAGTANNCQRHEAFHMALAGVVCGNCNNAGAFSTSQAWRSIFKPRKGDDQNNINDYDQRCAEYRTAETEAGRNYSMMMCSKGLFCPDGNNGGSDCNFHCNLFGVGSEIWYDDGSNARDINGGCENVQAGFLADNNNRRSLGWDPLSWMGWPFRSENEASGGARRLLADLAPTGPITTETKIDRAFIVKAVTATKFDRQALKAKAEEASVE